MINTGNYSSGNFSQDLERAMGLSLAPSSKDEKQLTNEEIEAVTLAPLTEKQREATLGRGSQYSLWFRSKCALYHRSGDSWNYKELQLMFMQGLLRHYISEETGYQFDYNYAMWQDETLSNSQISTYDMGNFAFIQHTFLRKESLSPKEALQFATILRLLIERFCDQNSDLLRLGAIFQKKKIELEKFPDNDNPLQLDREVEMIQQIIYHWIQDGMQKLREFVKNKQLSQIHVDEFQPRPPQFLQSEKYSIKAFAIEAFQDVQIVHLDDLLTNSQQINELFSKMAEAETLKALLRDNTN